MPFPLLEIPGDPEARALALVPYVEFRMAPTTERDALFTVVLEPDITVGQLNALLRAHDAHLASLLVRAASLQVAAPADPTPEALSAIAQRMEGSPGVLSAHLDSLLDKPREIPAGPAACTAEGVVQLELGSVCVLAEGDEAVRVVAKPSGCHSSSLTRPVHAEVEVASDGVVTGRVCVLYSRGDVGTDDCGGGGEASRVLRRAELPSTLKLGEAVLVVPETLPPQGACVERPG